jgi:hypothetical protein
LILLHFTVDFVILLHFTVDFVILLHFTVDFASLRINVPSKAYGLCALATRECGGAVIHYHLGDIVGDTHDIQPWPPPNDTVDFVSLRTFRRKRMVCAHRVPNK